MSAEPVVTKQELKKPDAVERALYALVDRVYRQRKLYTALGIGLVALILAGWGGFHYLENQRIERSNLYHAAEKILRDPTLNEADRLARGRTALEHVAERITEGPLAAVVRLELGGLYVRLDLPAEAEQAFQQALKASQQSPFLLHITQLNLAKLHASQQRWDDARRMLESLSGEDWKDVRLRQQALISLEQGNVDEARTHLQQLIESVPNSRLRDEAESLLMTL
jgi:predicted negative regulator of RcsB-dependent stress response